MKKKMLLHSCCAPCSSSVIEKLANEYDLTILYYNPNIYPEEEYLNRKSEQIRFLKDVHPNINLQDCDYDCERFMQMVKGYEQEKEGGSRCKICFMCRLSKTAEIAHENDFDCWTTTLSVSPYKNAEILNEIGQKLGEDIGVEYIRADFKKQDGYKRSIELSKEYNLYRQHYCGCMFSLENTHKYTKK